jgi:anti-anti-sigma factor
VSEGTRLTGRFLPGRDGRDGRVVIPRAREPETGELVLSYQGAPSAWSEHAREDLDGLATTGASVLVDLSGAEGIDSQTLGTLVLAQKRLRMNGGELALVCDRPAILGQLRLTGLDRTLPVHAKRP